MSPFSSVALVSLSEQAYASAYNYHGYLELERESFQNHLRLIIEKHSRKDSTAAVLRFFSSLHTNDLYLALACALHGECAWERLNLLYKEHIKKLARAVCRKRDVAEEIAGSTLTYLFLSEPTRPRRIASYQGLSSLGNWLAVVIHHRAIEELYGFDKYCNQIDDAIHLEDLSSSRRLDLAIRSSRYNLMVTDSLRQASRVLSATERWFLTLRYEKGMKVKQIAELAQIAPPTVTYHIQHAQHKLRREIRCILSKEYGLNELALKECIEEVIENPVYSLLNAIIDTTQNQAHNSNKNTR